MSYEDLKKFLGQSQLFTDAEVHKIVRTCGQYTLGNAIIACQVAAIELSGNDIDILIEALPNFMANKDNE